MALLNFIKPEKVISTSVNEFLGKFEFKPLEPGFGVTIGNSLRRVLLNSLAGFAITSVKIEGVDHEFSAIKGVLEDVTDIILNLKQIRFKPQEGAEITEERVIIVIENKTEFTAKMFDKVCPTLTVTNPNLVIFHCDESVKIQLEFIISKGRGYMPADDNRKNTLPIGFMPIDSIHTPIKNVKYTIENIRVGKRTDYEKLLFEISTDGTIDAEKALKESAGILLQQLLVITDREIKVEEQPYIKESPVVVEQVDRTALALSTPLEDLDLSVRAFNCLKSAKIKSLSELVRYQKEDLLKFRNFGQKSLDEITAVLQSRGLRLGMDLSNLSNNNNDY